MNLSQKCQYSVRAILELAKRYGQSAVSAAEIAENQAIPKRFLEVILNELKPSGIIGSVRGAHGGYFLAKKPDEISVGRVIRLVDGPLEPVRCTSDKKSKPCPLEATCSLNQLWDQARQAVEDVYDSTNFQQLAEQEAKLEGCQSPDYSI